MGSGPLLAFRYRLGEPLLLGSVFEVCTASDERTGQEVLAKLVRPAQAGSSGPAAALRLAQEADWLRSIDHPGIPRILADGWDEPTGSRFLVLEPMRGRTLADLASRDAPVAPADAASIVDALCSTLGEIHSRRLLHLGIGPSTVLVPFDPVPSAARLVDLVLHRAGERVPPPGPLDGPPAYMSPERILGGIVDERSDVYSVGALLFLMLHGAAPVEVATAADAGEARRHGPHGDAATRDGSPADPAATALHDVALRCLDADATRRPAGAADLAAVVRRAVHGRA